MSPLELLDRILAERLRPIDRRMASRTRAALLEALGDLCPDGGPPASLLVERARAVLLAHRQRTGELVAARADLADELAAIGDEIGRRNRMIEFLVSIQPWRGRADRRSHRELRTHVGIDLVDESLAAERLTLDRIHEMAVEVLIGAWLEGPPASEDDEGIATDLLESLRTTRRWQNRRRLLGAMADLLEALPPGGVGRRIGDRGLALLTAAGLDTTESPWVQVEATRVFYHIAPDEAARSIAARVEGDGDPFVREGLLRVSDDPSLADRILRRPEEPDLVRMTAARMAARHDVGGEILGRALTLDPGHEERVRGAILGALGDWAAGRPDRRSTAGAALVDALAIGGPIDGRVALEEAERLAVPGGLDETSRTLLDAIDDRIEHPATPVPLRRQLQGAREAILVRTAPWFEAARPVLEALEGAAAGTTLRFARRDLALDAASLGRTLALAARDGHGVQVVESRRHVVLHVGDVFETRLWRLLHELGSPAVDKRIGHRHAIGRRTVGTIRAPSAILAELSRTRVPGERVHHPSDGGWRPYLPRLDDLLAGTDRRLAGRTVEIYTLQGVTRLTGPTGPARLAARTRLTVEYSALEDLRADPAGGERSIGRFVGRVRRLGFVLEFRAHSRTSGDRERVARDPSIECLFRAQD